VFSLPNQLTAARFVLALVLFALIAAQAWGWCLLVFAVAAFTDWLDGYLARTQNMASALGRILDPLVDKVLMCGTYISLLPLGNREGWLLPWMVTVVVARELVITGLRGYLEAMGAHFGADWLGKLKMGLQCAAVIAIFVAPLSRTWLESPPLTAFCERVRDGLVYTMVLITLLSGLQYLWKAATLFKFRTAD